MLTVNGRPVVVRHIRHVGCDPDPSVVHVRYLDVPQYVRDPHYTNIEMPNFASLATVPAASLIESV